MAVSLALYQPDIAQNTGALIRLCACLNVRLHVIHPTGFAFSEKALRRTALDYAEFASVTEHASFAAFDDWRKAEGGRLVLLTTKGETSAYAAEYGANDILMTGRESAGVPDAVARSADLCVRIPMRPEARSLNVAMAGAMVLAEALRQTGTFP